jgi:hypothetical protein
MSIITDILETVTAVLNGKTAFEKELVGPITASRYQDFRDRKFRKTTFEEVDECIKRGYSSCVIYYSVYECAPMGFRHKLNEYLEKYTDGTHKIIVGKIGKEVWCYGSNNYEVHVELEVVSKNS